MQGRQCGPGARCGISRNCAGKKIGAKNRLGGVKSLGAVRIKLDLGGNEVLLEFQKWKPGNRERNQKRKEVMDWQKKGDKSGLELCVSPAWKLEEGGPEMSRDSYGPYRTAIRGKKGPGWDREWETIWASLSGARGALRVGGGVKMS